MLTFPDPRVTKDLMVADMIALAEADRLMAGTYGADDDDGFRGCAVGCSIHTINRLTGTDYGYGDHAALARAIGVPEALLRLQDSVFEGLPPAQRKKWPESFYRAIPEGADLRPAFNRILVRMLREVTLPTVTVEVEKWGIGPAIEGVCRAIETGVGLKDARAAADAAYARAYAAAYAAADAGYAAEAARAAYVAYVAYGAARAGYADGGAEVAYGAARAGYADGGAEVAAIAGAEGAEVAAISGAAVGCGWGGATAYEKIGVIICEEMERCKA